MLRSIAAVFAGFVVIVGLSTATDLILHSTGVFPAPGQPMSNGLWALATAYRFVFGILGCYLAARLAPRGPMLHALVLGLIDLVISMLGTIATWNSGPGFGPHWYPLSLVATAIPCAWIGGRLGSRR